MQFLMTVAWSGRECFLVVNASTERSKNVFVFYY